MEKHNNRLVLSVLATLTAGIALIYTLIMYHNIIFAVAGISVLFLITAYILTQNLIAFSIMKNKSINVHIKDCIDDISTQLEAMNGAQSQIGKATFLYTKQASQVITRLEDNYAESQMTLYKNLASLSNLQSKATRLMIKYDQDNTTKLISTIKDMRNQLNETIIQGFDQIQPNNNEVAAILEDIVAYLKSQPESMDEAFSLQLSNIAQELQNISGNIQEMQLLPQDMIQPVPVNNEKIDFEADAPMDESMASPSDIAPEDFMNTADVTKEKEVTVFATNTTEEVPTVDTAKAEAINTAETTAPDINANDMLSADEIAALFAAAEPSPKKESMEDKPFTPTFTVVGKSNEDALAETAADTVTDADDIVIIGDMDSDSGKPLSPDEIAALFAAAEPAPKMEEKLSTAEQENTEFISDDPNKQLSADEIAALFAAAEPAPKAEEEALTNEQEINQTIAVSTSEPGDPNKQLSPDEIAALFASLG